MIKASEGLVKIDYNYVSTNTVPRGFEEYYKLQSKLSGPTIQVLDYHLFRFELDKAVEYFRAITKDNISKIWH